jgi:hypothetical protein
MKSKKEMRKPERGFLSGADELRKNRKLKPVKKEKNPKRAFLDEIDELGDIDVDYPKDEFYDEDLIDDEEEDY